MVSEKVTAAEEVGLHEYELVVIITPEASEEALETSIENISRLITGKGGVISGTDKWGKRRLAYPIKHFVEGNYVLIKSRMKPAAGKELEANLQISESVLRHLLVKLD